jgi:hypothetical protein
MQRRGSYPVLVPWAQWLSGRPVTVELMRRYSAEQFAPGMQRLSEMSTI